MIELDTTTKKLLANPTKRRAWVIYQLNIKGRTLAGVASDINVERQTLYHAFKRPYPRMEAAIAESVGLTAQVLFAERYGKDGLPKPRASFHGGKHSGPKARRNTQTRAVA
jgi:Ner family transcriptional regulator